MRNTMKILASVTAAFILVPASDAFAQRRRGLVDVSRPHERHGFWLTLGAGAGAENFRYTNDVGCNAVIGAYQCDSNVKPTFTLAAGGTVSPSLRLGGEITGWVWNHNNAAGDRINSYLVGGLVTGQLFPSRRLGLFVKGGVGISRSGDYIQYGGSVGETGFAYLLGTGYEIRLSRAIFFTPSVSLMHHTSTNPDDPDNFGTFHERLVTFGLALTIQPGR